RRDTVTAHVFDGVLVAQPVRALDGVVHVPAPVVGAHVAERRRDAALRRHGVAARREHLGDAGGLETLDGHAEAGTKAIATGSNDHAIVLMIDGLVAVAADVDRSRRRAVALACLGHVSLRIRFAGSPRWRRARRTPR